MEIPEFEKKIDQKKRLDEIKKQYEFTKGLGEGGIAIALKCVDKTTRDECAIKILKRFQDVPKRRFLREIRFLKEHGSIENGIMPIKSASEDGYWYTMPIATGINQYLVDKRRKGVDQLKAVVSVIIQCAEILGRLHETGNGHRDLKPDNIYWLNNRVVIGDFGLVEVCDQNEDLTKDEHSLGAWNTLSPEMKRDPENADAKKADVYSLAKTLWILITNDNKCFDGRYEWNDPKIGLHFRPGLEWSHLSEIEDLLRRATSNEPEERPTMAVIVEELKQWQESSEDEVKAQISEWEFLKKYIFGQYTVFSGIHGH